MLNAILFDLDNTLILFDEWRFYQGYFRRIAPLFSDVMSAKEFQNRLISATRGLVQNDGEVTNAVYFMNAFAEGYADLRDDLWMRFLHFYETEYDILEKTVTLPGDLHETFEEIVRMGLKRVLASNPIFPYSIQMKRLAWAGLNHLSFDLVTHIENMSFCKPRIEYYLEICQKIGELPEACLMVGNDPVNDMVAAKAGLKTYLTDDDKRNGRVALTVSEDLKRCQPSGIPEPDFTGPLSELPAAVERYLNRP